MTNENVLIQPRNFRKEFKIGLEILNQNIIFGQYVKEVFFSFEGL